MIPRTPKRHPVLLAAVALSSSGVVDAQQPPAGPRIEIRHARETPAPGFVHMKLGFPHLAVSPVSEIYVEGRAIIRDSDFKEVDVTRPTPTELLVRTWYPPHG